MPTIVSPISGTPPAVNPTSTAAEEYFLQRDGDRDLVFAGWVIGHAQECRETHWRNYRCVSVTLFATESDNLVIQACRWQEERADEEATPTKQELNDCEVVVVDWGLTNHAIEWLKKDAGGKLGPTSKAAWVEACGNWEELKDEGVERV